MDIKEGLKNHEELNQVAEVKSQFEKQYFDSMKKFNKFDC